MNKVQRALHLQKWQQSGQSKRAYSESAGIKYQTFLSWFKDKGKQLSGHFRRIGKVQNKEVQAIKIVFTNGIELHAQHALNKELLEQLKNV
ncbi:MAG: hypothetical protein AAFY76_06065 [Cyanobacteria bacterium J06649_11]